MGFLLLLYAVLLAYGSWFPFAWGEPPLPPLAFLHTWPAHLDKGDIVQNVLVYMPFGLLMVAWRRRAPFTMAVALAAVCGSAVSLGIEVVQQYLPARVPSVVDIAMNFTGSVLGALLGALVNRDTSIGAGVLRLRDAWFRPGHLVNTGLIVIGLWVLAQTSPLVPSLDIAHLRSAAGYVVRALLSPTDASVAKFATLWCYQMGLGILLGSLLAPGRPLLRTYALLTACVCAAKLMVVGRVLSVELLAAVALSLPALAVLRRLPASALAVCGVLLLAAGLTIYETVPGDAAVLYETGFNWIPFAGQMNDLSGLENILEFLWPTMAMACLLRQALPFHRHDAAAVLGTVLVALGLFLLEWLQQSVPGRYGDITQVTLACIGWIIPWCVGLRPAREPRMARRLAAVRRR